MATGVGVKIVLTTCCETFIPSKWSPVQCANCQHSQQTHVVAKQERERRNLRTSEEDLIQSEESDISFGVRDVRDRILKLDQDTAPTWPRNKTISVDVKDVRERYLREVAPLTSPRTEPYPVGKRNPHRVARPEVGLSDINLHHQLLREILSLHIDKDHELSEESSMDSPEGDTLMLDNTVPPDVDDSSDSTLTSPSVELVTEELPSPPSGEIDSMGMGTEVNPVATVSELDLVGEKTRRPMKPFHPKPAYLKRKRMKGTPRAETENTESRKVAGHGKKSTRSPRPGPVNITDLKRTTMDPELLQLFRSIDAADVGIQGVPSTVPSESGSEPGASSPPGEIEIGTADGSETEETDGRRAQWKGVRPKTVDGEEDPEVIEVRTSGFTRTSTSRRKQNHQNFLSRSVRSEEKPPKLLRNSDIDKSSDEGSLEGSFVIRTSSGPTSVDNSAGEEIKAESPPLSPTAASQDAIQRDSRTMVNRNIKKNQTGSGYIKEKISKKMLRGLKKKKEDELTEDQKRLLEEEEERRRKIQEDHLRQIEIVSSATPTNTIISTKSARLHVRRISHEETRRVYTPDTDGTDLFIEKAKVEEGVDMHKKREYIVKEILSTEKTYVDNLTQALKRYYEPMVEEAKIDKSIDIELVDTIFRKLVSILPLNQDLYTALKERIDNWSQTAQIGDIFVKFGPFLKMYTQYSNSYESAKHALEESANQPWFIKFCNAKVLIESLLINPIQRIPRYALLLEDLWKNTPETHPDEPNLKIALSRVKKAADHVNEMLAKEKNFDKLTSEGLLCLLAAHRTLVMDEVFQVLQIDDIKNRKAEKLKTKEYKFFLFNDLLVFIDSVTLKKKEKNEKDYESWPTELMWPKRLPNNIIVIIGPGKHITLNCQSLEVQERWWHGLTEIIDTQLENTQTHLKDYTWAGSSETLAQRKGTMKRSDGYTYQGWWYRGNMQGAGVLEYLGAAYSGNFEKNVRDGPHGTMQFSNGTVYRGDFRNGKLEGQGELTGLNGDKFVGEWKDGMRTGEGELTYFNGDKYTGGWEGDNLSDTKATLVLLNRTTYVGPFSSGLYHGEGTLTSRVGTFFGDFVYGVKQGKGSMKWSGDVASYEGAWKSGVPHGVGAKEDWMGRYEGDWEKGMRKGKGKMVYKDGSVYEGHWVDDKRHGYGEYECEKGYITEYRGEWGKDKKTGKGVMKFAGGSTYDGSMYDDQPHGHGVLTCVNPKGETTIVEGKWVKGIHEGKSTVTLVKGDEKNTFLYDPDDAEFSDFLLPPYFPVISWQDGE